MLRTLITETYGGKIDDESDFALLRSLVDSVFTPAAFENDHKLVDGEHSLYVPHGTGMPQFMEWVNKLPEREPPTYLGLPSNAEKLLLVGQGNGLLANVGLISGLLEDGEQNMPDLGTAAGAA